MIEKFGDLDNGDIVYTVKITNGDLSAHILTWGAVIQDLRLAGHAYPLVLGFETFDAYPKFSPYFGAIAGRYANRIANGRFFIDGNAYLTDRNFLRKHTLHGGSQGLGKKNWQIVDQQEQSLTLTVRDHAGNNGFPGNCTVNCTYRLEEKNTLNVELTASCDAPTLCNLAHHSYFNLDGSASILKHKLQILADHYLPVDDELIPTGNILPVEATPFDFRRPRMLALGSLHAFDHNFCLSNSRTAQRQVACLSSEKSGIRMNVLTSEPGLQLYTGAKLDIPVPGLDGRMYGPFAGMALEPQIWPDSPNQSGFPQAILRPGDTYLQKTQYQFVRQ